MSRASRIVIAMASLALMGTFFLPVWQIDLSAPQYPEGLSMQIWLDKITGQVDIINGLNHYIGMKHIKAEMFPEFSYLTYVVIGFILLGLATALAGRRSFLFAYITLLVLGGTLAMVDFYQWGYDYGHNLDPSAAIQVPGLSYQPPLIGHKQLLNFDAYSYPASGGWLVIIAGLTFILAWAFEWIKNRKKTGAPLSVLNSNKRSIAAVILLMFTLASCETSPEPFAFGKDGCYFCKMTIIDPHFGGELITKKGKVYKFDDLHCLVSFLKTGEIKNTDLAQTLVVDYNQQNKFINASEASFVSGGTLHSPMNSNTAGFASASAAEKPNQEIKGQVINWETLYNQIN